MGVKAIKLMNFKYEINILIACILLSFPLFPLKVNFYQGCDHYRENNGKRNE